MNDIHVIKLGLFERAIIASALACYSSQYPQMKKISSQIINVVIRKEEHDLIMQACEKGELHE